MIEYDALYEGYGKDKIYSLQLEVGDECNQGCIYCYMNALPEQENTLSDYDIKKILSGAAVMGITSIEWLGGEPLLRENIFKHLKHAHELGFRNNMWTGGLPLQEEEVCEQLVKYCKKGLISVHLSTLDRELYKELHPDRPVEDIDIILDGIKSLLEMGYPPEQMLNSVTYTGMQSAEDMIETIDYFEDNFGIKTSLNVYHTYLRPETPAGDLEKFIPDRESVAEVSKRWAKQWEQDQPIMNCVNKQYCSATIAVLCDGSVTPCATIREEDAPNIHDGDNLIEIFDKIWEKLVFKKLKDPENLSEDCRECNFNDECWGCRSRAYAAGNGIYGKDPRCFRS